MVRRAEGTWAGAVSRRTAKRGLSIRMACHRECVALKSKDNVSIGVCPTGKQTDGCVTSMLATEVMDNLCHSGPVPPITTHKSP